MASTVPSDWIKNLKSQEEKNYFVQYLNNSGRLLIRLKQIIEEKEQVLNNQEYSINDFNEPEWSHKQAFRNGKRSALNEIKELIKFAEG